MSFSNIHEILDAQLETVVDVDGLQKENELLEASGIRSAWYRSTMLPVEPDVISLGSGGTLRQAGLYQVDLFYEADNGYTAANAMADQIVTAFDRKSFTTGGTTVKTTKAWRDLATREAQYYVVAVLARWYSTS